MGTTEPFEAALIAGMDGDTAALYAETVAAREPQAAGTIDETCDRIAAVLGVDPEKIGLHRGDAQVVLSAGQARRLTVLAERGDQGLSTTVEILGELLDQLPSRHHEKPGIIRAIEVLQVEARKNARRWSTP